MSWLPQRNDELLRPRLDYCGPGTCRKFSLSSEYSFVLVGGVAFGEHSLHDAPLLRAWDDAGYIGKGHDLVVLVFEDGFGCGSVALVNRGDGHSAFDGVAEIDRLLETIIHFRGQPADLSANLRGHAGNQQAMTDAPAKILGLSKAVIEMDRVVVPADLLHSHRVPFRERP